MSQPSISVITSLYRSELFLEQFLKYVSLIDNPNDCEFIFVHNDPSDVELALVKTFMDSGLFSVNQIIVKREGLYTSWNRAIKVARGKYLAIWNVDDIRTPSSLSSQKKALDNSNAVLSYGDFYETVLYGEHPKKFSEYDSDYNKIRNIALTDHIVGCFPMWKKEIHNKIGYFDEQFRLVADWDFQIRVALNYDLVKADEILGYYLTDLPHKLSSNRHLQYKEQTTVLLRYKIYKRILMHYLFQISNFKIKKFLNYGEWIDVESVIPGISKHNAKEIKAILMLPFIYFVWGVNKVSGRVFKKLNILKSSKV